MPQNSWWNWNHINGMKTVLKKIVNISKRWNMIFSKVIFWANVLKITFYPLSRQLKIHLLDVRWIHEDNEGFTRHISMIQNPDNEEKLRHLQEKNSIEIQNSMLIAMHWLVLFNSIPTFPWPVSRGFWLATQLWSQSKLMWLCVLKRHFWIWWQC